MDADLAREIEEMARADQAMRRATIDGSAFDATVDRRNTARLREIVEAHGWPTRSLVAEQTEHMAWLLVQHSDLEPALQERCLALMRAAAPGEVCPRRLAYLEDRVRLRQGHPQRYATQFLRGPDGMSTPAPLDDPPDVDVRRAQVGLESLQGYAGREWGSSIERRQ